VLECHTEKEVLKSWNLPGTVKVEDEDGSFHRRFGGTNTCVDIREFGFRCHDTGFRRLSKE